jgi:limonene 1,2-monooxygenase
MIAGGEAKSRKITAPRRFMNPSRNLRAGIFLPPFHPADEDPTLCMERDFELIEYLEKLGFAEAWIGEHHSGGFELYGAPDLFIATAAARTKRIMLGTGVLSLPYHHPFILADRMVQLDHQTRGRAMFGVGPGLLTSDAMILGIDPDTQRARMEESLEIIIRLMAGETVTKTSDWYTMNQARLQLRPYTQPRPHLAIASAITPNGGKVAGRFGLGMLSVAVSNGMGYDALDLNWKIAADHAVQHGQTVERRNWRLMAPFHIAETREKAMENVRWGFDKWQNYAYAISPLGGQAIGLGSLESIIADGRGAIGTPDDAAAVLEKFWDKTGGFGGILMLAHDWADWEATKRSYELFARYVLPRFNGANEARTESMEWMRANREEFSAQNRAATKKTIDTHFASETAKNRAAE